MLLMLYVVWMVFYLMYITGIITHLLMKEDLSKDNIGIFVFLSGLTLLINLGVFSIPEILSF